METANSQAEYEKQILDSIPTYLIPSIVSLLFCLIPGIVAVVYAVQTRNAKQNGDLDGAERNSGRAKGWMIAAFAIGVFSLFAKLNRWT